jgi:methyl-accepting chemotaxis protein
MDLVTRYAEQAAAQTRFAAAGYAVALLLTVGLATAGSLVAHLRVVRPVDAMTDAMRRLAAGDLAVDIPGVGRGDEVGAWPPPSRCSRTG